MTLGDLRRALADRFEIEHEVGHGGMAVVYFARDRADGHHVALKVLRPELAVSMAAQRFHREIAILRDLHHPNILPLLESEDRPPYIFYTMPYAAGGSLRGRLDAEGRTSLDAALSVARDVASAIDHAHAHNVLHRDIKPENILFDDIDRALVCDFGVARAVERATNEEESSSSGMVVGTPLYMSPEQAAAEKDIDSRTDVYALGAVLYEMLVGAPPFTGVTAQAIVARITKERPPPLAVARPDVPLQVQRAVEAALAKRPRDRPASGRALIELMG